MLPFCVLFLISSCYVTSVELSTVVVDSPAGKIQGAKKTDDTTGQSYLSFKGIPYAKPPLGDLRFTKPQPHPKIDDVFDASKDKQILCPQPSLMTYNETNYVEDCLILNIQTQNINPSKSLKKVIVFIHGGGFVVGTSSYHESSSFVISQDVIVVTINYRLGILGFLSTENEASPGNYGLWDQSLAIKWVKDNIRAFGGDPADITIAGESAGGMSVGYQILSPHSKGLFTKAYPQSGTATSVYGQSINAQSHAQHIAKLAGCLDKDVGNAVNIQESKALVDCLRKTPISILTGFNDLRMSKTQFVPVVDGDFVPDIPAKLLQDDDYLESIGFYDRSYLTGVNNHESAILENFLLSTKYAIYANDQMSEDEKESLYKEVLTDTKDLYLLSRLGKSAASDTDIVAKVDNFYNRRFTEDRVLIEVVTDLNFLLPSIDFALTASRRESCHSYLFYFNHFPHFMKGHYKGSVHGIEMTYWFDMDISLAEMLLNAGMQGDFDQEDAELKRMFSSIIGDFVKSGNPGKSLRKLIPTGWPEFDAINSTYLNVSPKPWVSTSFEKDKQDFWLRTMTELTKKHHVHSEL